MNKIKVNYWVDVIIGISFLASAVSGLVFFFDNGNGATSLGLSFRVWDSLHTWGGMLMIAGVAAHLALHWNWIVCMTKRMILPDRQTHKPAAASVCASVTAEVKGKGMNRRAFLALSGSAIMTTCLAAMGCGALAVARRREVEAAAVGSPNELEGGINDIGAPAPQPTETAPAMEVELPVPAATQTLTAVAAEEIPTPTPTSTAVTLGVACRKGIVNDPYPGRCRDYVDRDGDGICDLSVPGSGRTLPRNK